MSEKSKSVESEIIFFGETHGFVKNEAEYMEMAIKKLKPQIILYELLEDKKLDNIVKINSFLRQSKNKRFSLISSYGELKGVVELGKKYKLPIIGCDLKDMGRNKSIPINKKLTKKEIYVERKILKKRERHQMKVIKIVLKKYKIILVIVGAYHLRKNSPLRKIKGSRNIIPKYKDKEIFSPKNISVKSKIYYSI